MDCRNCGGPIRSTIMLEGIVTPHSPELMGGGQGLPLQRPVTIWSHVASGHERCEGREAVAEPSATT